METTGVITQERMRTRTASEKFRIQPGTAQLITIHSFIPMALCFNENTEEIFLTIQGAISDYDTQDGHVIMVKNGEYWEHLSIYKSLLLQGEDRHETIIDGRDTGDVVTICASSVTLQGFPDSTQRSR